MYYKPLNKQKKIPNKSIIISPSGNFYGSEQVLFDYLENTLLCHTVYVPKESVFEPKLKKQNKHYIKDYSSLICLYLQVFIGLLFKYHHLYLNEAAHVKYIHLLARIFKKRNFIVHIRISEDATESRLGIPRSNITLIVVSDYIKSLIKNPQHKTIRLYDPYLCNKLAAQKKREPIPIKRLGIIGRVTNSKGLKEIQSFISYAEKKQLEFEFRFYGHVENKLKEVKDFLAKIETFNYSKCIFCGFIDNTSTIYNSIDAVLHLNRFEPLGRICFESYAHGLPLFGFNSGGIGELTKAFDTANLTVEYKPGWEEQLLTIISKVNQNYPYELISNAQLTISEKFSPQAYCSVIDHLMM